MTSLRISIESGDAARRIEESRAALRELGQQAISTEGSLRRLSGARPDFGTDPFGPVASSIERAKRELEDYDRRRQEVFGAGTEVPFGAGLGGLFRAEEIAPLTSAVKGAREEVSGLSADFSTLGTAAPESFRSSSASAEQLAIEITKASEALADLFNSQQRVGNQAQRQASLSNLANVGTRVDARGQEILRAQEAYGRASQAAREYGTSASEAVSQANNAIDVHVQRLVRMGVAILGIQSIRAAVGNLAQFQREVYSSASATDLAADEFEFLQGKIVELSTRVPVATSALFQFSATAGRLQIGDPQAIFDFVESLALIETIAPGIAGSAEQLGLQMGRFITAIGEGPGAVRNVADAIAGLKNEFATTPQLALDTAFAIARVGAGSISSAEEAIALGTAMSQAGIDGVRGGSALAEIMIVVRDAVRQGGDALETLQEITGKNREQLSDALRTDSANLFVDVLEGIARTGGIASDSLERLGLAGVKHAATLNPLIQNTDSMRRAIEVARGSVEEGGVAMDSAEKRAKSLTNQFSIVRNVAQAFASENLGLANSLSSIVTFGKDVAATIAGVELSSGRATTTINAVAVGLQAAGAAGVGLLVLPRIASGFAALSAPLTITTTSLSIYTGAAVTATTVTTGLSAAFIRARAAALAFATSPAGIAIGIGAAVAGIVALSSALDDVDASDANAQLDLFSERLERLDQAASGLTEARSIIIRAERTDDAEAKLRGLQRRLQELEGAADAVAGELGEFGDIAPIPAAKLEALRIDDLFPDVEGAGLLLQFAVETAYESASATAERKLAEARERIRAQLRTNREVPQIELPNEPVLIIGQLAQTLPQEIERIFGEDAGRRAAAALSAAIAGEPVAGLAEVQAQRASDALRASLGAITTREVDADGVVALERLLESTGLTADEVRQKVAAVTSAPSGEFTSGDLELLSLALSAAGVDAVSASRALDLLGGKIKETRDEVKAAQDAVNFREPQSRASEFFLEESQRINEAIRNAELSIGRFNDSVGSLDAGDTVVRPNELRGLEARIAALQRERDEYDQTIQSRLTAQDRAQQITNEEAESLRGLADELLLARTETVLFAESQRRLGVEQQFISNQSALVDEQLRILALTARGETAEAFDLLRERIELARQAAERDIQSAELSGIEQSEIDKLREFADAQQAAALQVVALEEELSNSKRSIDDLANASTSFASNFTDALFGIQEPLDALRNVLLSIGRQILEPRLAALFLRGSAIGGGEGAEEAAARAAQQVGVRDLLPDEFGASRALPEIPDVPDLSLGAQAADAALTGIGVSGQAADAALAAIGVSGQAASTGIDSLGVGAGNTSVAFGALAEPMTAFAIALQAAKAAAIEFAAVQFAQTTADVAGFIGPTIPGLALGNVLGGGKVQPLAAGGLPGVSDLSGSVVDRPTLALIGEGSDREAVLPLDSSGGIRAKGPGGDMVSLGLERDPTGKLGVRLPGFAMGGVLGGRGSDSIPALAPPGARGAIFDSRQQNKTVIFNSSVNVYGAGGRRSPVEAGMRYSVRQYLSDIRSGAARL